MFKANLEVLINGFQVDIENVLVDIGTTTSGVYVSPQESLLERLQEQFKEEQQAEGRYVVQWEDITGENREFVMPSTEKEIKPILCSTQSIWNENTLEWVEYLVYIKLEEGIWRMFWSR